MRNYRTAALFAAVLLLLAGCAGKKETVEETTIETKKNGTIVHTIVEDFAESYYSLSDLETLMRDSCDAYNESSGKGSVQVESSELEGGVLTVVMKYKNAESYAGFNRQPMFSGTVREAYNGGYDLDVSLLPADNSDVTIGKSDLLEMGEKHLVILREATDVKVWGKVLYYSPNVMGTQDPKKVRVTGQDTLTYIVFE